MIPLVVLVVILFLCFIEDLWPHGSQGFYSHIEEELRRLAKEADRQANNYYPEAEKQYKRDLAFREEFLGPEHPDLAINLNNLADLYKAQDKYAEAEPLYKRSLAIQEKALGPEHTQVIENFHNLCEVSKARDKYAEVESLLERKLGSGPIKYLA